MRALTIEELRALLAAHQPPCLSFYMPTSRTSPQENRLRFEGLVKKARDLLARNLSLSETQKVLAPLEALSGEEFWKGSLDGLALFHASDHSVHFHVPMRFSELAIVADSFHVRPLLRFMQADQRYFLLNLSQGAVSFYTGSASGLAPTDLRALPKSLTDALGIEDRERELNFHSSASHGRAPIFHGQSKSDTSRDEDLLRFFRIVDRALWEVLRDENAPLVVAAPERLHSFYRSVSRYAHLSAEGVQGNFDGSKVAELHTRAWPIVQRNVKAREDEVIEHYGKFLSRGRALDEISQIARFAVQGRVRELMLDRDARLWGRMNVETGELEMHEKQKDAQDDDVLDDIAEAVLVRGGEVYAFDRGRMPTKSPVAAVLRW